MPLYPKISIITPSFNQKKFIEKTIQSVLNQNYPNIEYIVIDGGSTDGTVDVIKKYSAYLKHWVSEPDKGQSDAINKGLKYVSGEVINWLNSDDFLEDGALFKVANEFNHKEIHVLCGYSRVLFSERIILKRTSEPDGGIDRLIACGHFMQPSTFWRSSIFTTMSPIETSLHYMMDHYIWLKYVCRYGFRNVCYIDSVLSNVHMHEMAKSVRQHKDFFPELRIIYCSLLKNISGSDKTYYYNLNLSQAHLPFLINETVKINHSNLNFLLLTDQLKVRNSKGKFIGIDIKILYWLVIHFKKQFLNFCFQKTCGIFLSK